MVFGVPGPRYARAAISVTITGRTTSPVAPLLSSRSACAMRAWMATSSDMVNRRACSLDRRICAEQLPEQGPSLRISQWCKRNRPPSRYPRQCAVVLGAIGDQDHGGSIRDYRDEVGEH